MIFMYVKFANMKQEPGPSVKSAGRALDLVEHVALHGSANARALSRATGIPESSLSYLLATLLDRGWLVQAPDRSYSKGPALAWLAAGAGPPPLAERARILLRGITKATHETSSLFVRNGDDIEVIDVELSNHALRFTPQRGLRVPLHSFAAGKAILATLEPRDLAAYFAHGERQPFTPSTIVEEEPLRRDLELARERGYAFSREEHTIGVIGLGVALDAFHSISVAIPSPRFDIEIEGRTVAALQQAVAAAGVE